MFSDEPLSLLSKVIANQVKRDRVALKALMNDRYLLSLSSIGWKKTGIVKLFLTEFEGNNCLIVTDKGSTAEEWDYSFPSDNVTVVKADDFTNTNYRNEHFDMLVFDVVYSLNMVIVEEICNEINADYILGVGLLGGDYQEVFRSAVLPKKLKDAVSSWDYVPQSDLHHTYFLRYYPISLQDFEATNEEWFDRKTIWDFKNNPDKQEKHSHIAHDLALSFAIRKTYEALSKTFGDLLSELTLVCIPASSPLCTEMRYKEFSEQLCDKAHMSNAYPHITVKKETLEKHLGGEGNDIDSIEFDWEFFKGRNIILFDDILTSGKSMRKYANLMSSHGAEVIACITLGKTFHHREGEEPCVIEEF